MENVFAGQSAIIAITKTGRALFGMIASGDLCFHVIPNSQQHRFVRGAVGVSEDCKFVLAQDGQLFQILISDGVPLGLKPVLSNVRDIAAGNAHAVAVTRDGKVYSWGDPYQYVRLLRSEERMWYCGVCNEAAAHTQERGGQGRARAGARGVRRGLVLCAYARAGDAPAGPLCQAGLLRVLSYERHRGVRTHHPASAATLPL